MRSHALRCLDLRGLVCSAMAAVVLLATFGCSTVEGAGKDIENAGEAIQDAAD